MIYAMIKAALAAALASAQQIEDANAAAAADRAVLIQALESAESEIEGLNAQIAELEANAASQAVSEPYTGYQEVWTEPYYAEPEYTEPDYGDTGYDYPATGTTDLYTAGVVYGDDGQRYTWYSENALPGQGLTALNENGRTVDQATGYVVDGDGYIAVASPDWSEPIGTVIETPWGAAKVYDYCGTDAYDVYVSW